VSRVSTGPALGATWAAPANIALVKYWGSRNPDAGLPLSPSLSMTLRHCVATCTVRPRAAAGVQVFQRRRRGSHGSGGEHDNEGSGQHGSDRGNMAPAPVALRDPVAAHVRRIMQRAGHGGGAEVAVEVTFPVAAGLASSAAIFAAVTCAAIDAFDLELHDDALADLARAGGSGSAARSVAGGFVEWRPGTGDETELEVIAPASHWEVRDVIAIADPCPKRVSSREGHRRAFSSPYFDRRLALLDERIARVRDAIRRRDIDALGAVAEEEAVDLHLIAMSSRPPIRYWRPATVAILEEVEAMRHDGVSAWSTLDAGPNVHVLCEPGAEPEVARRLAGVPGVQRIIRDRVGEGPVASARTLL
jgi:diphosphomevalonate decarboxylase